MTSAPTFPLPFNTAQIEILRLFAEGVNEEELTQLRQILIDFKFNRVTALADKILDEKGWSAQDLAKNAQKMERTPYRSKVSVTSTKP
jgi:hypothetical protein